VKALAARKAVTAGQLALAWVLAKGDDVVPIPGTKRRKYLEHNAAAANVTLSDAEVAELETAVPPQEVAGGRYAEAGMKSIDE
jgi:aryl-alcohol dehydrogenase-like predicted oxidoreductase